jgi:hypothetical protein
VRLAWPDDTRRPAPSAPVEAPRARAVEDAPPAGGDGALAAQLQHLRASVDALREEVADLRADLADGQPPVGGAADPELLATISALREEMASLRRRIALRVDTRWG